MMTEEENIIVRRIVSKPHTVWTKADNDYLWSLFKRGHRDQIKAIRNEMLLSDG